MIPLPPLSTLFPYTTLFRSSRRGCTLSLLPSGPDEVRCACCTGPGLIRVGRRCGEDNGGAAGRHSSPVGNRRPPSLLQEEAPMKRADIYLLGRGIVDGVGQMTLETLEALRSSRLVFDLSGDMK